MVQTQIIQVGSHSINRTTFACPDNSLRQAAQTPPPASKQIPTSVLGKRNPFEKRNAAECRTSAPECQCGQDCKINLCVNLVYMDKSDIEFLLIVTCACQNVTAQAPASSDCAILIDSTQAIAQVTGPTFVVQPDNFELITFGTCALEWTNLGCSPLEYCWDELVSISSFT